MATESANIILRHIRQWAGQRLDSQTPDRELLERFSLRGDAAAFEALLRRHGPMVLRVCRRLLPQWADAEDVFQATFLTLARKAASIRRRDAVAAWLHGVAYRLAQQVRIAASRRSFHESRVPNRPVTDPLDEISLRDALALLDEELARLPEHLRAPLVLCYLEGTTRDEAAGRLGWSLATIKRRLERGRQLLHKRLTRRGVTLSATLLAAAVSETTASAAVPASLASGTMHAALQLAAGHAVTSMVSANVAALVDAATKPLFLIKLKAAALLVVGLCVLAVGAGVVAERTSTAEPAEAQRAEGPNAVAKGAESAKKEQPKADDSKQPRTDRYGDPLPEGAIARLGTVRFLHAGIVRAVAFSLEGTTLASAGDDKMIRLWDVTTGKELQRLSGHANWVYCIAFSPDRKTLASAGVDQTIRLWNLATGKEFRQLRGHQKAVNSIAFSLDGKVLASGSNDQTIRFWEVRTGKELRRCAGNPGQVCAIHFSTDGRTLVSASYDAGIRLWGADTGKELRQLGHPQGRVHDVALSQDGTALAAANGDDLSASLWEVASGKMLRHFKNGRREFSRVAFSPDGTILATGGIDGMVRRWEVASGEELPRTEGPEQSAWALAFSPDGKMLATGSPDHRVRLWRTRTGEQVHPFEGHLCAVRSVHYGADSKTVISASYDGTLRVWEAAAGKELRRFGAYRTNRTVALALSRDRQTLVSTNVDQKIHCWDPARGKEQQRFDWSRGSCLAFFLSPDGKILAAGLKDGVIRLYDVPTGKEVRLFAGQQEYPHPAAFSPDGKWLAAVCFDKAQREMKSQLKVWSVETGAEHPQLKGQQVSLGSTLCFSSDGKMIAAEAEDKVYLWEITTGKKRIQLDQGRAYSLDYSPDGRTIASGHWDGTVSLWDLATGKRICRFEGHRARVFSVAFSPNGRTLTSGSEDATALIWDLSGRLTEPPQRARLAPTQLESLWKGLADSDAAKAYQAICNLATNPKQTVPFLQERLRPIAPIDNKRILQLIANLDSDRFMMREEATQELEKLAELTAPALRKALADKPPLEVRRRAEGILQKLEGPVRAPETLRALRSVEALEHIATPEAQALLKDLAKGASEARLTQEAKASLDRLGRRNARTN